MSLLGASPQGPCCSHCTTSPSTQSHPPSPAESPIPTESPTPTVTQPCSCRLQELEDQYRREREEATYLLEQQRLVRAALPGPQAPHDAWVG